MIEPVVLPFGNRLVRRRSFWFCIGLVLFFATVSIWMAGVFCARPPEALVPVRSDEGQAVTLVSNPGYLGANACLPCHTERVKEFQSTRHFLANRLPQSYQMPLGFGPGQGTFSVPESSLRFEMTQSERKFLETAVKLSPLGIQAASSTIAFCYGAAGGNDEVYFAWRDDRLYELPMVWLAEPGEWGASPFDRHGHGDFSREMTIRCVECHNTWFEHASGSRNQYGRDHFVLGVSCEVCHGPGREHVAFHQRKPDAKEPQAIVRPARLSRERQIDLCANCHSNALKHRGPAFSYRPGRALDDDYFTLQTKYPEDDHVANQTTYMRQSRCFQASETMTCVTCHNPHQPRSETNAGTTSCFQCHTQSDCHQRSQLPDSVRDECIACHMPERRKIQVYFRTQTDKYVSPVKRYEHRIGVYPDATLLVMLNWHRNQSGEESRKEAARLSKLLAEFWLAETDTRQRAHRFLAAIDSCRESLRFDSPPAIVERLKELIDIQARIDTDLQDAIWHEKEQRYEQAIAAFHRVLELKPDHATANARLGTTFAVIKSMPQAIKHLQAAAEFDPNDPYAPAMLGWLAYLDGDAELALSYFTKADAVEPYSAKINFQMGLALTKLGRVRDAIERFHQAQKIDPKDVRIQDRLRELETSSQPRSQSVAPSSDHEPKARK